MREVEALLELQKQHKRALKRAAKMEKKRAGSTGGGGGGAGGSRRASSADLGLSSGTEAEVDDDGGQEVRFLFFSLFTFYMVPFRATIMHPCILQKAMFG